MQNHSFEDQVTLLPVEEPPPAGRLPSEPEEGSLPSPHPLAVGLVLAPLLVTGKKGRGGRKPDK